MENPKPVTPLCLRKTHKNGFVNVGQALSGLGNLFLADSGVSLAFPSLY